MKTALILLSLLFSAGYGVGQSNLLPSVGLDQLPDDGETLCEADWYLGSFDNSGLFQGNPAHDFQLFDLNGNVYQLGNSLKTGIPTLLISGSYTCPVFRNKIDIINTIASTYAGLLDVQIVYTIEAHPDVDTSAYFGYVNPGTQNQQAGILYRQPTTYGERKAIIEDMMAAEDIQVPVLIDGPCNEWWNTFGPAPNNAYLIDTTGLITAKHGWFHKYPANMFCDIDSLLGMDSGLCGETTSDGDFEFTMTSADTVFGATGTAITIDAELYNPGGRDIVVYARRLSEDIPEGWSTSMCIDVCYPSSTDSVLFVLPGGATQAVHAYFFTNEVADTGFVRIGFRNEGNFGNTGMIRGYGVTQQADGLQDERPISRVNPSPNPVTKTLNLPNIETEAIRLTNSLGQSKFLEVRDGKADVKQIPPGTYWVSTSKYTSLIIIE